MLAVACPVEIPIEAPLDEIPNDMQHIPEGAHLAGVGSEAFTFLRADTPRMVVEVHMAEGFELSEEAIDHLMSVARQVLDKPEGIELRTSTFTPETDDYSAEDIRALEERVHEVGHAPGEVAALYVLALNGEFRQAPVIGVAYSGTSFAVFTEQIRQASTPLVGRVPLERAVLVHELGHLLRLVNIGYSSPRDREDPERPHHSVNEDSVMHRAVQSVGVMEALRGGPPDTFDQDDLADLEDLRAGRLP